jgi:hypothetical protein
MDSNRRWDDGLDGDDIPTFKERPAHSNGVTTPRFSAVEPPQCRSLTESAREGARDKVPRRSLVPIRYGRMLVSPLTFLPRGRPHHGQPSGIDAGLGIDRAVLRRRSPLELRGICLPREATGVRHQTTSTRRSPDRGSGTSSDSRRACWSLRWITASTSRTMIESCSTRSGPTARRCASPPTAWPRHP